MENFVNFLKKIEETKSAYVNSVRELEDIKFAYEKCNANIKNIRHYIPFVETKADEERIRKIIAYMEENGLIKKNDKTQTNINTVSLQNIVVQKNYESNNSFKIRNKSSLHAKTNSNENNQQTFPKHIPSYSQTVRNQLPEQPSLPSVRQFLVMNESKPYIKRNLKQLDICTAFEMWKSNKRKSDMRKIALLSSGIITVEDSDSEETITDECDVLPKKKRPLKYPFPDDEELETPVSTPSVETEEKRHFTHPFTCSTPVSSSSCKTFVGYDDLNLSQISGKIRNEHNSASTSDSERTIINEQFTNCSSKKPLIMQHIIIPPTSNSIIYQTYSNNTTCLDSDSTQIIENLNKENCTRPIVDHVPCSTTSIKKGTIEEINNNLTVTKDNLTTSTNLMDIISKLQEKISATQNVGKSSNSNSVPSSSKETNSSSLQEKKKKRATSQNKNIPNQRDVSDPRFLKTDNVQQSLTLKQSSNEGRDNGLQQSDTNSKILGMDKTPKPGCSKNVKTQGSHKMQAFSNKNKEKVISKFQKEISKAWNEINYANTNLNTTNSSVPCTSNKANSSISQENKNKTVASQSKNFTTTASSPKMRKIVKPTSSNISTLKQSPSEASIQVNTNNTAKQSGTSRKSLKNAPESDQVAKPSCSKYVRTQEVTFLHTSFRAKKEEKKLNKAPLILIIDLFKGIFKSRHLKNLLEKEKDVINRYINMVDIYQYVCYRLFTRKRKWYNVFKFCNLINVDMEKKDILIMFEDFEKNEFIDTDYSNEDVMQLLRVLNGSDLKSIYDNLIVSRTVRKKDVMINRLLNFCNTQSTLTVNKTTQDVLKEKVEKRMGRSIRLNEHFQEEFEFAYILATFSNPMFSDMNDYVRWMQEKKIAFPEYPVEDYTIFHTRNDFVNYARAKRYFKTLETAENHLQCKQICETIFKKLQEEEKNRSMDEKKFADVPYLIRFTARYVCVSALCFGVDKLYAKFSDTVKVWLEYMIVRVDFPHKIGFWYYHLIWLYMRYLKPFNYERAAELLIYVLTEKRKYLSDVQLYKLHHRGRLLISVKKYKILQRNHDIIAQLLPTSIKIDRFPIKSLDASARRSNIVGKKRNYEIRNDVGERTILKVEDFALKYYLEELHYSGGMHCEGELIKATFTLFFFDIIYSKNKIIPATFVSTIQSEPLDMNTRYFYENRKAEIDKRLKEIESEWPTNKVINFVNDQYEKHSHEYALCEVGAVIDDSKFLETFVRCVGKTVLGKIYRRLVENFKEHRSGLPDLFIWKVNANNFQCKFVEVKGENDKLSVGQMLWLDYLQSIGAEIEVCHVHSIGSKRKIQNASKASTSRITNDSDDET